MSEELREFFFMRDIDVVKIIFYYGFIFPLMLMAGFFLLYNHAQRKRLRQEQEKQRNLKDFSMKGRSNGVKHEEHERS